MKTTKDMTEGAPWRLILGFAVPLLFGLIFQQIYSLVDTIIVGQFLGVDALAAVGATGSINFLIIGFCLGVCSGFGLPVAQRFGAKDFKGLKRFVGNATVLSAIFSVVITVITAVLCRSILEWMKTPENIIDMSYDYIFTIFLSIPFIVLYNLTSSFIRSLGDSKTPLVFLVLAAVLNIILDLLFIVTFKLGVFGAALATAIAQGVSGILCLIVIVFKFDILHITRDDLKLNTAYVQPLLMMGLPMGFQYSITAIGSVVLQTAVNTLGSIAVASITAGNKIGMFVVCPFDALGATMATYGGQNVGAGRLDRLTKGLKAASFIGCVYSVFAFILLRLTDKYLLLMFVSPSETEVIKNASSFLFVVSAFYIPLALVNIVRFLIQGMGFSGFAIFAGVAEMIGRSLVALILVPIFGFMGASLASPVAWIFADSFLIPGYFRVLKRLKEQIK